LKLKLSKLIKFKKLDFQPAKRNLNKIDEEVEDENEDMDDEMTHSRNRRPNQFNRFQKPISNRF